jgi:hypothetical protein
MFFVKRLRSSIPLTTTLWQPSRAVEMGDVGFTVNLS